MSLKSRRRDRHENAVENHDGYRDTSQAGDGAKKIGNTAGNAWGVLTQDTGYEIGS